MTPPPSKPYVKPYARPYAKPYARREYDGPRGPEDRPARYEPRPYRSYDERPYPRSAERSYERPYERPYEDRPREYRPRPAWREDERPRSDRPYHAAAPAAAKAAPTARDPQLDQRLQRVKLFLCDVDGILTDAGVFMGQGEETKRFNLRDGFGLRLLQREGVKVGWISHRASVATTKRAEDLKIDFLHQAPGSKVAAIEAILATAGVVWEDVCFMGDDIVDLGALKRAGLAVTIAQAVPEAKALAHYVTKAAGGHGAVREIAEMILKAQSKWAALVAEYSV